MFQSSFELTGYITGKILNREEIEEIVSKLFRAYGLYNRFLLRSKNISIIVSKLFRAYGLYNPTQSTIPSRNSPSFKALSSLRVI